MRIVGTKILVLLTLLVAQSAMAVPAKQWDFKMGVELGLGKMDSTGTTYKSRWTNSASLYASPTYNLGGIGVGAFGEYRTVGQITEVSKSGGNNTKGSGWLVGPGILFNGRQYTFFVGYGILGNYDLAKKSAGGQSITYKSPSAWKVLLGYRWTPKTLLTLGFQMAAYGKRSYDGAEAVDVSDDKLQEKSLRGGITLEF